MKRTLNSVGKEKFVRFYNSFKNGGQDKIMQLLIKKGDKKSSAQTRWYKARRIFLKNGK